MNYSLPKSLNVCGVKYEIRSDFRAALDICAALSDDELNNKEKALVCLDIMYPSFGDMPSDYYEEAIKQCFWFINCGAEEEPTRKTPKLMDWEQDFQYIVAPINRVMGKEIRESDYLHWWTFVSAFYEIGDCTFAQVVRIRNLKAKGKKLDKADQEWYQNNRKLVDMKRAFSESEKEVLKQRGV